MAPISVEELCHFHSTDRQVFAILIIKLGRTRAQSLLIMALWLWLENVGYPNIIARMVNLSHPLIHALANEAKSCLNVLEEENPRIPATAGLPLTSTLIYKDISLQLFNRYRYTAITGIKSVLNNICSRIFTDILHVLSCSSTTNSSSKFSEMNSLRPLVVHGFPHAVFGAFNIPPKHVDLDLMDKRLWDQKRPSDYVKDDDKTMFLTFSRGFSVSQKEVVKHFIDLYGKNSVKAVCMGNEDANGQPLFAVMLLDSVKTLDNILNGKRIAKFRVNGKHIWARKYERRE